MSRRNNRQDLAFGSDSFLDIIANIVGILIILIVVAGVKVSQAPLMLMDAREESATEAVPNPRLLPPDKPNAVQTAPNVDEPDIIIAGTPAVREASDESEPEEPPQAEVARSPESADEVEEEPAAPEPLIIRPSPQLLSRIEQVRGKLSAAEDRSRKQREELVGLQRIEEEVQREFDQLSRSLRVEQESLSAHRQQVERRHVALDEARTRLTNLQFQLQQAEHRKPPAQQIRHRVTPVSHEVDGNEIHFRLENNRVAAVPVEQLLDRLKFQVERQKDWLVKYRRHQGTVGPVKGFRMEYVVERQQLSVIDELRHGSGVMRIGVSQWQILPEDDLVTETAEMALRPGSAFHRALMLAEPDSTLTFWVYPDSYDLFRKLQQFAHQEGMTVAGRPLPFGVQIAGSPNGTRSAGQ